MLLHYTWCTLVLVALYMPSAQSSDWGYHGEHGPDHWPAVCAIGKAQSPIDIPKVENLVKAKHPPFVFYGYDETAKKATLSNNGHTIQLGLETLRAQKLPMIGGGGLPGKYVFAQFHFHWGSKDSQGSEHTIQGKKYPMELHLVHFKKDYGTTLTEAVTSSRGANDTLAVLGVMFEIQEKDNDRLEDLVDALDKVQARDETADMSAFPMVNLLPRNTESFYRYQGSLTTPGCNELVIWTVFKTTVGISSNQLAKFRTLLEAEKGSDKYLQDNFRPVQDLQGRKIYDVETSEKIFKNSATTSVINYSTLSLILAMMFLPNL